MRYRCPYCGKEVKGTNYCNNCLMQISWAEPFWKKSYLYYNQGLKHALNRNLTSAKQNLKKAVIASKYNIEARNLLGLIYMETGETGAALKEWIISSSLVKENNVAASYIEDVHKEMKTLQQHKEAIDLYNNALTYLRQKNGDMAIIRLKKAVNLNPGFVKARVLLGLCYLKQCKYAKAEEMLKKALETDHDEPEALKYYYELSNRETSEKNTSKENLPMRNNETGIKKVMDRSVAFSKHALYFILGAVCVFVIYTYLFLPARVDDYKKTIEELTKTQTQLQQKVQDMTKTYDGKVDQLEKNKKEMESKVAEYEGELGGYEQKEKLAKAQSLADEGSYKEAAQTIYEIVNSQLDEEDTRTYESLKEEVYQSADELLYDEANSAYNQGNYDEAITAYENILLYEPKEKMARKTLYYLGCSEKENNNPSEAKRYFSKLISDYEGSREAQLAEEEMDDLSAS